MLRAPLGGGPGEALASDVKVLHPSGRWAYKDLLIRCGPADPEAIGIDDPVVVIDALSPGTKNYDL